MIVVVPRYQRPFAENLPTPQPPPSVRVSEIIRSTEPSQSEWLAFQEQAQREQRKFAPGTPQTPQYDPLPGLRALLAEEALGELWEGFSRPQGRLQCLSTSWESALTQPRLGPLG